MDPGNFTPFCARLPINDLVKISGHNFGDGIELLKVKILRKKKKHCGTKAWDAWGLQDDGIDAGSTPVARWIMEIMENHGKSH